MYYYYQLRNCKQNIPKQLLKTIRNNLEEVLTSIIEDSLVNTYTADTWKN